MLFLCISHCFESISETPKLASIIMEKNYSSTFYPTLAGFCLIAIAICLTRLAYTPIVPSIIDSHWVTKPGAGYLGAFNMLGYMAGCILTVLVARITGARLMMRLSLVIAVIGLLMCSWDLGFIWLAVGRFITGFAGAALIIHTPPLVLKNINPEKKAVTLGIVFSGAGFTIVAVSFLLPQFITNGPKNGWLFEAAITAVFAIISWNLVSRAPIHAKKNNYIKEPLKQTSKLLLILIAICYFLAAVGIVPHSLFLSDYVHRDLGYSISDSSMLFSALGLGSAIGPVISGVLAKKLDTSMSLFFAYLTGVIAVLIILMFDEIELVALSAFLAGIFLISVVSLTSLRVLEIVGLEMHDHYWGILTLILASGWAIGSYSMSGLLSLNFQYINLFMTGQAVLALALGIYLFSWWRSKHI